MEILIIRKVSNNNTECKDKVMEKTVEGDRERKTDEGIKTSKVKEKFQITSLMLIDSYGLII